MESGTVAGMTADPERETAALAAALASAGYAFTGRALADLLRGVLAAPEPIDPEAWLALVGADLPADLRDRLRTLKSDLAATASDPEGKSGNAAAGKLAALRAELRRRGLDGFVVPRADEHQGESVPARAERLAWLTGFTGSAGVAVVLRDRAAVFIDGRYTLQVERQVDRALYSTHHLIEEPPHEWLASRFGAGGTLGYDPWLHTRAQVKRLRAAVETAGASLVACDGNPLDAVWVDQPDPPVAPVLPLAPEYCGRGPAEKRRDVARALADKGAAAAVLTQPDSIAWLLNVRGGDVARTPLPLSFALLHEDATVEWFLDPRKVTEPLERHLGNRGHPARAGGSRPGAGCPGGRAEAGAGRPRQRRRLALQPPGSGRRGAGRRRRSLPASQGQKECRGDRRQPARPSPRRPRPDPLPVLVCPRGAGAGRRRRRPGRTPGGPIGCWRFGARTRPFATSPSTPFRVPDRTARWFTTGSPRRPAGASRSAISTWSIPAPSTWTAPPT